MFSLAGHLYAMSGELGERLDVIEVQDLMRYWNDKLGEPLSDRELMTATDSAGRNGTARAEKPIEILSPLDNDPDVGIDGILKEFDELPEEFPQELLCVPGFIGDLIEHNLSTAIYPLPELALAGAIAMMSTLTGGKVEGLRGRTNLYVMGLAPSGGGKDYARGLNREILTQAGFSNIIGSERIGSHAGIITALSDSWNTLFQIDEIGRLLATMQDQKSPHLYNIVSVLLQLYSSAGSVWKADAYADSKKVKTLHFPHCVIYGTSVPDGFWESLSRKNLTEGLIGRFLVFEEPKYVDYTENPERDMPESIIERAKLWLEHKPHDGNLAGFDGSCPQKMTADEEASSRLTKHAKAISEKRKNEDTVEAAIWSRHAEKTNKLALLFACSRWSVDAPWPIVRIEDADRAIKLNNWLTRRMLRQAGIHVADNQTEREVLRLKKILSEKKTWRLNELSRRTQWLKSRDRADLLKTLQQSGEIISEEIQGKGRPATVYTVV